MGAGNFCSEVILLSVSDGFVVAAGCSVFGADCSVFDTDCSIFSGGARDENSLTVPLLPNEMPITIKPIIAVFFAKFLSLAGIFIASLICSLFWGFLYAGLAFSLILLVLLTASRRKKREAVLFFKDTPEPVVFFVNLSGKVASRRAVFLLLISQRAMVRLPIAAAIARIRSLRECPNRIIPAKRGARPRLNTQV